MILTVTFNPAIDWNITVDRLGHEEKNAVLASSRAAGGKGLNVSRVLTRLGAPNRAFVVLGGAAGDELFKLARREKVAVAPFGIAGETRVNLTLVQKQSRRQIRINQPGPRVTGPELRRMAAALRREFSRASVIVFSGSLLPGMPASFLARLLRAARRMGIRTVVDADGAALRAAAREKIWLLKPNLREWASIRRRAPGASVVLISKGARGAEMILKGARLRTPAFRRKPVSTVGAGDSLLAGFLHAVGRGADPATALRFGCALGAASVGAPAGRLAEPGEARRILRLTPRSSF